MSNLQSLFEKYLQYKKIIKPGDQVFVACSGGPDSVALLHLLKSIEQTWKLRLEVLHYNHGWRGKHSDQDERFVRDLAKKLKIPFRVGRTTVSSPHALSGDPRLKHSRMTQGLSPEEAAREERYQFFCRAAKRYSNSKAKIVLAHTRDDQAETVLMRIIQGTGLRGLLGIREVLKIKKATFVRPLLDFSKEEILQFLKQNKISFRTDHTNDSPRFLRNRIRLKLLPLLREEFNPRASDALARLSSILRDEHALLEELDQAAWKRTFKQLRSGNLYLDRKAFLRFPGPLQFRILDRALKRIHARSGMSYEAWERLRPHLSKPRFRHSLPKDIDLYLTPLSLKLYKKR